MPKGEFQKKHDKLVHEIDKGFKEASKAIAEDIAEEESHKKLAAPKKVIKEKVEKELHHDFELFKKRIETGMYDLFKTLVELSKNDNEIFSDDIHTDISRIMLMNSELLEHRDDFANMLSKGVTIAQIYSISDKTLDSFYKSAKYLYEHQQYKEAAGAFHVLCLIQPENYLHWFGLGCSEYFNHNYDAALIGYAIAGVLDPFDPHCQIYSCKCYEALHNLPHALNALDIALDIMSEDKKHEKLKKQVQSERQRLHAKMQK